jgi:hypothetical protein
MLRSGRVLPWAVALLLSAACGFLLSGLLQRRAESRRVSAAPVVEAIRKIAQLATVEIQVSDVFRVEELKSFLIFDFPKSATIRMRGKVVGGFDLESPVFDVRPHAERRFVEVRLPPPRILALDPRLEWFDERSGIFNPITPQDRTRWMLWARGQLGRAAKQAGLEKNAVDHARQLIEAAAKAFGWRADVKVASDVPGDVPPESETPDAAE